MLPILQLLLISLQRLGRQEVVEQVAPLVLEATAAMPWENGLLRLTLGESDPSDVLTQA